VKQEQARSLERHKAVAAWLRETLGENDLSRVRALVQEALTASRKDLLAAVDAKRTLSLLTRPLSLTRPPSCIAAR
jgi:hypothetical protein